MWALEAGWDAEEAVGSGRHSGELVRELVPGWDPGELSVKFCLMRGSTALLVVWMGYAAVLGPKPGLCLGASMTPISLLLLSCMTPAPDPLCKREKGRLLSLPLSITPCCCSTHASKPW